MNTLEALLAALEQNPDDPLTRQAIADWYEEQGDSAAAAGWRWLLANGKRPFGYGDRRGWRWWCIHPGRQLIGPDDLPRRLFDRLAPTPPNDRPDDKRTYPTRRAAEDALIDAFRRAVQAGWQPEPAPNGRVRG